MCFLFLGVVALISATCTVGLINEFARERDDIDLMTKNLKEILSIAVFSTAVLSVFFAFIMWNPAMLFVGPVTLVCVAVITFDVMVVIKDREA